MEDLTTFISLAAQGAWHWGEFSEFLLELFDQLLIDFVVLYISYRVLCTLYSVLCTLRTHAYVCTEYKKK